jgi:hypothetical protein
MKTIFKIIILVIILVVVVAVSIFGTYFYLNKGTLSSQTAAQKAINYLNENLLPAGLKATLSGKITQEHGLYKFAIKIEDQEFTVYVTKNGKIFFPEEGIDLEKKIEQTQTQSEEIPKKERPDVKLFVMSYCDYGLQMEKALLPVWQLLKDKADIGIYFVDYLMHGKKEMEENLRQYCIQKEDKEKYLAYLECFVKSGNSENCLKEAGINQDKLNSCQQVTDKEFKISENFTETGYPPFNIHKDLNDKYIVQGSPTLVINDKVINVQRSPEKVKETICKAFSNPPSECQQKLSEEQTSPGFGTATSSSSSGSCQ